MAESKLYKDYFNIDPKYFPQVTEALIKEGKVSWKNYFANPAFLQVIEQTYNMILGDGLSMFTWGPYGSGKSHLVLTLISMMNASDEEVTEYFQDQNLPSDLLTKFLTMKNCGEIITIHRIGSANIISETDLILAVQQSIMKALGDKGITNQGEASMKDSFLNYLSDDLNKTYFDGVIKKDEYAFDFSGQSADDVISVLTSDDAVASEEMMRKVMRVMKDIGQYGLFKDANAMSDWIKDIIDKNNLKAIVFAWDEFSEFLISHPMGLTGMQTLLEISNSHPFYFITVSHEAERVFADAKAAKKFLDRFQKPVEISLPENTAFKLLANALKITNDPLLSDEWNNKIKPTLNNSGTGGLSQVRKTILNFERTRNGKKSEFSDEDLQNVVPIHPYAALILRQIASMFNSNQRSMFDFIISDNNDSKGFKWFINNYGPFTKINILTVDLLWDFFCGKQISGLSDDVRGIFLSYDGLKSDSLLPDEQRVLKTILILQAVTVRMSNDNLLSPNAETIDLAFSGTGWPKGKALNIARGLVDKGLVFEKPMANGKKEYCVANGNVGDDIGKYRQQAIAETKTSALITSADLLGAVAIPKQVNMRYKVETAADSSFQTAMNNHLKHSYRERIKAVVTFAMNVEEAQKIKQQIIRNINMPNNDVVFIETLTPMGEDLYKQYIDALAYCKYYTGKDKQQANHYQNQAEGVLRQWYQNISNGAFWVYTTDDKNGSRKANVTDLGDWLMRYDQKLYTNCLEQYSLNATLYDAFNLSQGAELGIKQETKSAYKVNTAKMSIENALADAWHVDNYWNDPTKQSALIVKVKKRIEEIIEESFLKNNGEVSILHIYDEMEKPPFGFMPNAITSFVLGFCLKEYATSNYFWSNHSNTETMTIDKMKGMIANTLNHRTNEVKNFKEEYIVTMTAQMRGFLNGSAEVFGISQAQCTSIESTRDQIRIKMKSYSFPIWCVKYVIAKTGITTSKETIEKVIDSYLGIANTANANKDSESVLAERIGTIFIDNPDAVKDLKTLINDANCRDGMLCYIDVFEDGELKKLAQEINDGGNYIDEVKNKFSASDGNWVWNIQTANEKISDVILEYKIIRESNKSLSKCKSLKEIISEWATRTNNIKMPCEIAAKQTGDLGMFLWQLSNIKRNGTIAEQDKQKFYDLLCQQREAFDAFYKDQIPYFVADASSFVADLSDTDIAEIYNQLPSGQFTKGKTEYYNFIKQAIDKYISAQWKKKMLDMWREKTDTKDPEEWSNIHNTPILCMIEDSKRSAARKIFDTIKSTNPSDDDAKEAIDYMENEDFYGLLKDQNEIDKRFMRDIVGTNSVILKDIKAIRNQITKTVHDSAYYWLGNTAVQHCIKNMVDMEYKLNGSERASQIIDTMDAQQLRDYLKRRIADDAEFGLQILKGEV